VSECVDPKRHIRLYSRVHVGLRWNTDNTLTKHKLDKKAQLSLTNPRDVRLPISD